MLEREFSVLAASKPQQLARVGLIEGSIGDHVDGDFGLVSHVRVLIRCSAALWLLLACGRSHDAQVLGGGPPASDERAAARPRVLAGSGGARVRETSGGSTTMGGSTSTGGGSSEAGLGGTSHGGGTTASAGGALGEAGAGASHSDGSGGLRTCEPLGEADTAKPTRFAVFGDYSSGPATQRVSELVKSWRVDFILTAGDNNYPVGGQDTIDVNIGQYYADFICPYRGSFGNGASKNRFFPALGNHDWYTAGAQPYLDYFALPGNERYYDFIWGNVHAFVLDSDPSEPDGVMPDSVQATWLSTRLAASVSRWKIVVMHHPPYSSGPHGSSSYMQWPFKAWGVDVLFAGHDHDYERIEVDGLTHIVTGLGGISTYGFNTTISGSRTQFNSSFGAGLVEADEKRLSFRFLSIDGEQLDAITLGEP
jgi:hypothetical protein